MFVIPFYFSQPMFLFIVYLTFFGFSKVARCRKLGFWEIFKRFLQGQSYPRCVNQQEQIKRVKSWALKIAQFHLGRGIEKSRFVYSPLQRLLPPSSSSEVICSLWRPFWKNLLFLQSRSEILFPGVFVPESKMEKFFNINFPVFVSYRRNLSLINWPFINGE